MSSYPLVSIITVTLNNARDLEHCIKSVHGQNYPNIEYILIDGGSTDGTMEIIKKYEKEFTHWISEPDMGLYHALNKGIGMSSGDFVGIVNSDDWLEPDAVEAIMKNRGDHDMIAGDYFVWIGNKKRIKRNKAVWRLRFEMSIHHGAIFVRRELYEKCGEYNTSYKISADYDFVLRAYLQNAGIKYIDNVVTNFREGGLSRQKRKQLYKENMQVQIKLKSLPLLIPILLYFVNIMSYSLKELIGWNTQFRKKKVNFRDPFLQKYHQPEIVVR